MAWKRRFPRWVYNLAIPNLTLWLIGLQLGVFVYAFLSGFNAYGNLALVSAAVLDGEVWRLFSFLILPPGGHWVFLVFVLMLFYNLGTALEAEWGSLNYSLYWGAAWLLHVGLSFLVPLGWFDNHYMVTSTYIAFGILNPNYPLNFLLIPVAIPAKWFAIFTFVFWMFGLTGMLATQISIGIMLALIAVCFRREFMSMFQAQRRRVRHAKETARDRDAPFHTCSRCGATDRSHPDRQFFYEEGVCICEACDRLEREA